MTDIVVFAFGVVATSMCAAAIGMLVWAAREDGRRPPVLDRTTDRPPGIRGLATPRGERPVPVPVRAGTRRSA